MQSSSATNEEETTKATFLITGLHCPPCTRTVESSLSKREGIHSIKVDWKTKNARVVFDESVIPAQTVSKLIADTRHMMGGNMRYGGWLVLKVPSIKDDESAKPAKEALSKIEGVRKVLAYPKQHSIGIQFSNKGEIASHDLIAALKQAGIEAAIY
jgi:copper chaperone CopZ